MITGPSGVGKGTLLKAIFQAHPELYFSISATTRSPRPNEIEGQHYYFLTPGQFQQKVAQGDFLEWAEFAGHYYGTPKDPVLDQVQQGKTVILEIELEGARQVRRTAPQAQQIFIAPPSIAELEARIRNRGQDDPQAIARRLKRAETEIAAASEFDHIILNDDLNTAGQALTRLLFPEAEQTVTQR